MTNKGNIQCAECLIKHWDTKDHVVHYTERRIDSLHVLQKRSCGHNMIYHKLEEES